MNVAKQNDPVELALSIFVAAAVAFILESFISYFPGDAQGTFQWIAASLVIIVLTIGIIFYVMDFIPNFQNKKIWLKIGLVISSTMTFFSFTRFLSIISTKRTSTSVNYEMLNWNFNSWVLFMLLCGVILFVQGWKVEKGDFRNWFLAFGFCLILVSIIIIVFIPPTIFLGGK